jgi:antitoxin (DNA-binding transcriptional repressor) of toxin-antitoxin stability system
MDESDEPDSFSCLVARVIALTQAKARISGFLDAVEPGEKMVVVYHRERVACLRRLPCTGGLPRSARAHAR